MTTEWFSCLGMCSQHHCQKSNDDSKSDDETNADENVGGDSSNGILGANNNNTTHSFLKLLNDVKANGDALMRMVRLKPLAAYLKKSFSSKAIPSLGLSSDARSALICSMPVTSSLSIWQSTMQTIPWLQVLIWIPCQVKKNRILYRQQKSSWEKFLP